MWLRQSNKGRHKLTPPWEGPYIVAQVLKPETYKLANEKGEILTNAWNIESFLPLNFQALYTLFLEKLEQLKNASQLYSEEQYV